jgi:hypothetical protein
MEKDLKGILLKDLCARIPYKVQASYYGSEEECETWDEIEGVESSGHVEIGQYILPIEKIKPYLFPLSSMTEEHDKEFALLQTSAGKEGFLYVCNCANMVKWLVENHFDYNCLIEKGLALDATNLNIY